MSIFVSEIAFGYREGLVNIYKISILLVSMISIFIIYKEVDFVCVYKQRKSTTSNVSIYKEGVFYKVEIQKSKRVH